MPSPFPDGGPCAISFWRVPGCEGPAPSRVQVLPQFSLHVTASRGHVFFLESGPKSLHGPALDNLGVPGGVSFTTAKRPGMQ